MILDRVFDGVPAEVRRKVEPMIDAAIMKGIHAFRDQTVTEEQLHKVLISCIASVDSAILLMGAFRRDIQKLKIKKE